MTPRTVWLASYPRSGNTWTRAVLAALAPAAVPAFDGDPCRRRPRPGAALDINAMGGGPIASARPVLDALIGFPSSDLLADEVDALRPAADAAINGGFDAVTVRKIHDGLFTGPGGRPIVDVAATRAAIYLVRDPRDVAVSLSAFRGRAPERTVPWMADPEAALGPADETGIQVRQRLGPWSAHVDGWTGHDLFPVEVFRYEDLHADPVGEFARLAAVAGLVVGRDEVAAAVAATRFDRLREQETRHGFRERPTASQPFFRRGIVGSWRDELPVDLVRRIERDHGPTMARMGYPASI